jgi:hypothetical protein
MMPNPPSSDNNPLWDPGENRKIDELGWSWRDNPVLLYNIVYLRPWETSYTEALCALDGVVVIREFEGDMIMNYVQGFFDRSNNTNQSRRYTWTEEQLGVEESQWVKRARDYTSGQ